MSLYKKYRPDAIEKIVGNKDVVSYLRQVIDTSELPHTLLLSGPTGCGKTTVGRIIKNELGVADIDFKEINTANMRGIDTVREIIQNAGYHPAEGDARIYLIDECHKLTNDAQNAFLKILEDTPEHVYFILCTTEPNKLLGTIRGRCQELRMNQLTEQEMKVLLLRIVKSEKKKIGKGICDIIYRDSFGHPRNAIQILEQVLLAPLQKQKEVATKVAIEYNESIELCRALISQGNSWKKVSNILNGLKNQEAESIRRHVLGYAQSVLLKNQNDQAASVIEEFREPLYDIGFPGLVYACYSVVKG